MDSGVDNDLAKVMAHSIESVLATVTQTASILSKVTQATMAAATAATATTPIAHAHDNHHATHDIYNNHHAYAFHQDSAYGTIPFLRSLFSFSVSMLTFMTMTMPTAVYRLLSWSFTLHLTFTTLLIAIAILCFIAWAVIRYRVLTRYSRLPKASLAKHGSSFDLHPDNPFKSPKEEKEALSYPDEFLSAFLSSIKIFGYLEQPVFHELARHLQTRRLPAGDTILQHPELEKSFYIVVDGCVRVYEKMERDHDDDEDDNFNNTNGELSWDEQDGDYQLLNEVKNGGTLSSLFTILSLFTENVKLRHEDEPLKEFKRSDSRSQPEDLSSPTFSSSREFDHARENERRQQPSSQHDGPTLSPHSAKKKFGHHAHTGLRQPKNTIHTPTSPLSNPDHMAVFDEDDGTTTCDSNDGTDMTPRQSDIHGFEIPEEHARGQSRPSPSRTSSYQPPKMKRRVIVAKAMVDTTLAVIPAEAFHRLTQKFPQAAAHIVQVILIRFQRVTLLTGHKYLGLTKELLRMERSINEIGSYGLPPGFFRPKTMEYLKAKFSDVRGESDDDDDHPIAIRIRNSRKRASRLVSIFTHLSFTLFLFSHITAEKNIL